MNSKQGWNKDKCRCAWIERIDKGISDKGFIWNPSNCECECDNSWNVGEYVDYSDSKYRKKSSWWISWRMYWKYQRKWIDLWFGAVFVYFYWYSRNEVLTNTNPKNVTTIY